MSSSPNSFEDYFESHEPRPELDSPFLNEEYLAEEARTAPTWRIPVPGFQLESPFLHAFEGEHESLFSYTLPQSDVFDQPIDEQETTGIIDQDNRKPVINSLEEPYRWICQISGTRRITYPSSGREESIGLTPLGTGILISPRHVLTAAHLLSNRDINDDVGRIDSETLEVEITPARNGEKQPFRSYKTSLWRICSKWNPRKIMSAKDSEEMSCWDYAVIILEENIDIKKDTDGKPLCFWGCNEGSFVQRLDYRKLFRQQVFSAGYPGDKGGKTPWSTAGEVIGFKYGSRLLYVDADATQGQSGSPVWIDQKGKRNLTGIFIRATKNLNVILRVTQDFIKDIRKLTGEKLDMWFEKEVDETGNLNLVDLIDEKNNHELEDNDLYKYEEYEVEDSNLVAENWEGHDILRLTELSLMHDDFNTLVREDEIIGFDTGVYLNLQLSISAIDSESPETIPVEFIVRSPGKLNEIICKETLNIPKISGNYLKSATTLYKISVHVNDISKKLLSLDEVQEVATVRRFAGTSDAEFIKALGSSWKGRGQAEQAQQCNVDSSSPPNERPDALKLLQSGGVAILEIQIPSVSVKVKGFIRNPADVFYYTGHGLGLGYSQNGGAAKSMNCLAIEKDKVGSGDYCCWATPSDIIPHWKSPMDLDVFIIAGCSVLAVDASTGTVQGDGLEWAKLLKVNGGPLIALLGYGDYDKGEGSGPMGGSAPKDSGNGNKIAKEMGAWIKKNPSSVNKSEKIIEQWLCINIFHHNHLAIGMDEQGFCWRTRTGVTPGWKGTKIKLKTSREKNYYIEKIKMI